MRHLFLLFILVLGGTSLTAQTASIVVLQATTEASGETNVPELRREVQEIIDGGLESQTYGSLGCTFRLETTRSQQISGMAKRTVARYTFTLTYLDYVLDIPVGEPVEGTISGSGGNAAEAASNALSKLRKSHFSPAKLQEVVALHREQLPACGELQSRLNALRDKGEFTAVLAVAQQLTATETCSGTMEELAADIYARQQATDCRQLIIRAKAEVVAGNVRRAARLLAGVDPTMGCADEVEELLDELLKRETIRANYTWYNTAYRSRTVSPAARRRVISNLILEYAYQRY